MHIVTRRGVLVTTGILVLMVVGQVRGSANQVGTGVVSPASTTALPAEQLSTGAARQASQGAYAEATDKAVAEALKSAIMQQQPKSDGPKKLPNRRKSIAERIAEYNESDKPHLTISGSGLGVDWKF